MDLQHPSTAAPASQQAAVEASISADKQQSGSEVGTRLHGVWLLLARGVWLGAMALAVVILIAAVPVRFSKLLNFLSIFIIDTSTTRAGDLDPHAVQNGLQQLGISPASMLPTTLRSNSSWCSVSSLLAPLSSCVSPMT